MDFDGFIESMSLDEHGSVDNPWHDSASLSLAWPDMLPAAAAGLVPTPGPPPPGCVRGDGEDGGHAAGR